MLNIILINGKIKNKKTASILISDCGFYDTYAVYETLRTYQHKIFLLSEHYHRLKNGAKLLGIKKQITLATLQKQLDILIEKNPLTKKQEYRFKIILTPNSLIIYSEQVIIKKDSYKLLSFYNERSIPQIKHYNYLDACYYQQLAFKKKYDEALYYDCQKNILECACANIFMVKNNIIYTPQKNILPGVTRKLVLKLAKKNNIRIKEHNISLQKLYHADEVFITQTTRSITPISYIDGHKIKSCPGKTTKKLIALYNNFINITI